MNITKESTIAKIVTDNYATSVIFQRYNIDFYCNGNRSLEQVVDNDNLLEFLNELRLVESIKNSNEPNFNELSLNELVDYIEKIHHSYVEQQLLKIKQLLEKVIPKYSEKYPELIETSELLYQSSGELATHMKKEELILFPWIKKMVNTKKLGKELPVPHFKTIQNPISMMLEDHNHETNNFHTMRKLSKNYTISESVDTDFKKLYQLLDEFELDLHKHIHLENNILFPKAIELENQ